MSNIKQLSARRVLSRIIYKNSRYLPPIHRDHGPLPQVLPMFYHPSATPDVFMGTPPFWLPASVATQKWYGRHSHLMHRNTLLKIHSPTRTLKAFTLCYFTSCPIQMQRPTTQRHQRWRIPPHRPISQPILIIWWSVNETVPHPGSSPNASAHPP